MFCNSAVVLVGSRCPLCIICLFVLLIFYMGVLVVGALSFIGGALNSYLKERHPYDPSPRFVANEHLGPDSTSGELHKKRLTTLLHGLGGFYDSPKKGSS